MYEDYRDGDFSADAAIGHSYGKTAPPPVPPHASKPTEAKGGATVSVKLQPDRRAQFATEESKEEYRQQRGRILTMKYGKHQMMLIRKRLRVEMWLMEQLENLFDGDEDRATECNMDLDQLLDFDTEDERIKHIRAKLQLSPAESSDIDQFVTDVMVQLKTL